MLVDIATYQLVTKDMSSTTDDVTTALTDAQQMVDEHCHRTFEYAADLTETLDVNSKGFVYPSRTPVVSVSSPQTAQVRSGGIYVGPLQSWPPGFVLSPLPPQVDVTYSGGYLPYGTQNPASPVVPIKLMRAMCRVAWLALHPTSFPGVPAGAKSASVGDVSVTGDLSPFIVVDPSIERDLRGFMRRRLGAAAQS